MSQIRIQGAKENNLKNVDVNIPHNKLTVITGLSGSGKSSLVRDILQREGQRMYLETLSSYNRVKLGKIRPAKVTDIQGLLPVISIGQTHIQANRRSTAGTFSDISPLFRQLFSRFNDQQEKVLRNNFSFNSEKGWCKHCKGLGIEEYIDINKILSDANKSLREGALIITLPNGYTIYSQVTIDELQKVCNYYGFSVDTPWKALSEAQQNIVLNGSTKVKVLYGKHSLESRMKWTGMTAKPREEGIYKGIIPVMEDILRRDRNDNILRFVSAKTCTACKGEKINENARKLTWKDIRYAELENMSFQQIYAQLKNIKPDSDAEKHLINFIKRQIGQLCQLSVGHIAPNRLSETLSQGELRRMRLAQLNHSGLTGILYLFDEPSIGLHIRDVKSLIETFYKLVNKGNTVVVVEHNDQIIRSAQHLIELGPGAGKLGGEVILSKPISEIKKALPSKSLLKETLYPQSDKKEIQKGTNLKPETFKVEIASANNIANQEFEFARQQINVITGVSGAGKSTLVTHGLLQTKAFSQIMHIDQKPIGRTTRSNPATYTGLFDELRKLFAQTTEAKVKKLNAGHFSFNNKQGQCEACLGTGTLKTGMHIFEDLIQECPLCRGRRYKPEILNVAFQDKNIHEILEMSINEASEFFAENLKVHTYLNILQKLGLGYLHLGQSSTTLSGGEAQRIKLASELHKKVTVETLYVLDEPTTGLHSANINILLNTLRDFIKKEHTVVLIEHDKQVIENADWIVDIGPEGGENGGKVLFCGPYKNFVMQHESPTTKALKAIYQSPNFKQQAVKPSIHLEGITTNNLKNINIHFPAGKFIAFTGVSGSGKTSLLIDTIHSEGQRLFTENMSTYRRLQVKMQSSASIKHTHSIMPAIAITADEQKPDIRSTAATLSGLYDLMRLLYARFASNPDRKTITAADFSLNNEYTICQKCEGAGFEKRCLDGEIIINPDLSLLDGALIQHKTTDYFISPQNKYRWILMAMAEHQNIDLTVAWKQLNKTDKEKILYGTSHQSYNAIWQYERKNNKGEHQFSDIWKGLCHLIEEEYRIHYPSTRGKNALELLKDMPCGKCKGNRLDTRMLQYTFEGIHMGEALKMNFSEWHNLLQKSSIEISSSLKKQLTDKLKFLIETGLGKIPLGRPARWLSTGELKWIKLGSILASSLSGMCIILDEPSAGMDENSLTHLLQAINLAKKRGNTILVSDHHKKIIQSADLIVEIGPGAGEKGGEIILETTPDALHEAQKPVVRTIKSQNFENIRQPKQLTTQTFEIDGYSLYENRLNLICGKTGSGKTTLLKKIYQKNNRNRFVIFAQSKTLAGNKNSTIATRTSILNDLKKQFARLETVQKDNLKAADFGFNNKKMQCPKCKGNGYKKVSMDFIPDIMEICDECRGTRYKPEILRYQFKGKNIAQWLNHSIEQLLKENWQAPKTLTELTTLRQMGLAYLSADREISTLSDGEQRRFALAEELWHIKEEKALILFDSPSHGLDPLSLKKLIHLFDQLIESGHTIIMADEKKFSVVADNTVNLS
jgi:excinuclease ABC subunit A